MSPIKPAGQLSKSEIEYLLRALRANTKAAKAAIMSSEPKLRESFEQHLNTSYPLRAEPVWMEAFQALVAQYEKSQAQVDKRCDEMGLPRRFRPQITHPRWDHGGVDMMLKGFRAELRRVAYLQISAMIKERQEEMEREAARVQLEILAHGCLTDAAKAFIERLPKIDELFSPITTEEVYGLLEGNIHPDQRGWLPDRKKPECLPDLGKGEDAD
jgi:hypothetical protein